MAKRKQPQEVESDVADENIKETEISSAENDSDANSTAEDADLESQLGEKDESPHASGLGTWAPLTILALLFLSFLFLFFVAFSAPLIHPIYLFSLDVSVDAKIDKASGSVEFGVWGYCSSAITNTVGVGPFKHTSSSGGGCSPVHLGWNFDGVPGPFSSVAKAISRFASGLFVFHLLVWLLLIPALGTCAIALLKPDLFSKKSSKPPDKSDTDDSDADDKETDDNANEDNNVGEDTQNSASARKHKAIPGFAVGLCAILVSFILLIDAIVLGTTSHNVKKLSSNAATLKFGNAFFLVLVATLFLWIAFGLAVLDLTKRIGKDAEKDENSGEAEEDGDGEIEVTDKTKDEDEKSDAGSEKGESSASDYGDDMHEVDLTDQE